MVISKISNMFPALTRITSSIASTANYSLSRVLSFTGSFNERTSLLPNAAASPSASASPPQVQGDTLPPATTTTADSSAAFDIEAAAPDHGGDGAQRGAHEDQEPAGDGDETKRVSKIVQTVCLFAASASLVLFANLPDKPAPEPRWRTFLYNVTLAFICLGLFTSLALSMFSIVARPGDAAVARVQKRAMVMAVAFVLVSFTLRMCMTLPAESLESAWLIFFILAGTAGAGLYVSLAWKLGGGRRQNSPDEEAGAAAPRCS